MLTKAHILKKCNKYHLATTDAPFGARGFKKQRVGVDQVAEALEKKKKQKKTFLEAYYNKWGKKKVDVNKPMDLDDTPKEEPEYFESDELMEDHDAKDMFVKRRKKGAKQAILSEDQEVKALIQEGRLTLKIQNWGDAKRKQHIRGIMDSVELVMSSGAKEKARRLHDIEPHYWTPKRLASFFKCSIEKMRGFLYEGKLIKECRMRGIPIDEKALKIDDLFGDIFGTVDFPDDYFDTPEEIPIRKIHNPWYYVDPGLKSGNLLKFLRRKETRHYREASKIPTQQYPKLEIKQEILGEGIKPKVTPPGKIGKMIMYDSSVHYHLYDRPIMVNDSDNTWRTATWAERRAVENSRRQIKYPFHEPFEPECDHQPDWIAVENKPPGTFNLAFGDQDYLDDVFGGKKSRAKLRKVAKSMGVPDLSQEFVEGAKSLGTLYNQFTQTPGGEWVLKDIYKGPRLNDNEADANLRDPRGIKSDEEASIFSQPTDNTDLAASRSLNRKSLKFADTVAQYRVHYGYE